MKSTVRFSIRTECCIHVNSTCYRITYKDKIYHFTYSLLNCCIVLADIQESQYLSNEEYSSLFDHPATSLPDLMKIAIAKDRHTSKGIAAVLQKHGYDVPSKTVIGKLWLICEV